MSAELELVAGATGLGLGVLGVAFGLRCYLELRRWARLVQRGRIAVARKNRVKLEAPIIEFVQWCEMLHEDEATRGRVIYRDGHVSVALLRPAVPAVTVSHPGRLSRLAGRLRRSSSSSSEAAAA